jgi:hypothetical protein
MEILPTLSPHCLAVPAARPGLDPLPGIAIDALLVEACRERRAALEGIETLVDPDPAALRIGPADGRRLARCVSVLLDVALAAEQVAELDLSVRRSGEEEGASLILAVRVFAREGEEPVGGAREGELVRVAHLHAQRSGGALLVSSREGRERRFTLALDMRSWSPRAAGPTPDSPRMLIADDNPRARRALARLAGVAGFRVDTAPGALDLLRSIDPDETNARTPDVLLLDESWLAGDSEGARGLAAAVEAALPAKRVFLLTAGAVAPPDGAAAWRRLAKPIDGAALQPVFEVGSAAVSERKLAAERPYSLSR